MMYNVIMISEELKDKRIANAEWACREAGTDWAKDYWFGVFRTIFRVVHSFCRESTNVNDLVSAGQEPSTHQTFELKAGMI